MARFGVDYAWGDPGVQALKAAQVTFVCRYLSNDPSKDLRDGEAKVLRAAGIDIVTVWESTANRALDGAAAGRADAQAAQKALDALGAPKNAVVYFAVDFDMQLAQRSAVLAYLYGAAKVLGRSRTGVYGGLAVVKAALDAKVCKYAWQTYAWSGMRWDSRAQLQQYDNGQHINGVSVDYDRAIVADFGQWNRPSPIIPTKFTFHPLAWINKRRFWKPPKPKPPAPSGGGGKTLAE